MNILIVSPNPVGASFGGGGIVERDLGTYLLERGHSVTIIATIVNPPFIKGIIGKLQLDIINKVPVLRLPLLPTLSKYPKADVYMPPSLNSLLMLNEWLKKNLRNIDIVHVHDFGEPLTTYLVSLFTKYNRPPYVLTLHGFPNPEYSKTLQCLLRIYEKAFGKFIVRNASYVTATSPSVSKEFIAKYSELTNKITVIPNGISLKEVRRLIKKNSNDEHLKKEIKMKFHIPEDHLIIFSVGRLVQRKGLDVLIKSLKIVKEKIPNVTLVVAGETYIYLDHFQSIARKENVDVKFVGFIEEELKYQLLKTADIVVIPSLKEGFGLVALEAMAAGAPIVASNCSGLKDILKHKETALMTTPANDVELASAITRLLDDTKLRSKISKAGIKEVERYDWNNIVERYIKVYESVVKH
jgi:glycosyltransferase involved in cell wall biosynthesis